MRVKPAGAYSRHANGRGRAILSSCARPFLLAVATKEVTGKDRPRAQRRFVSIACQRNGQKLALKCSAFRQPLRRRPPSQRNIYAKFLILNCFSCQETVDIYLCNLIIVIGDCCAQADKGLAALAFAGTKFHDKPHHFTWQAAMFMRLIAAL